MDAIQCIRVLNEILDSGKNREWSANNFPEKYKILISNFNLTSVVH